MRSGVSLLTSANTFIYKTLRGIMEKEEMLMTILEMEPLGQDEFDAIHFALELPAGPSFTSHTLDEL